jgi:2-keto-4-pentenoate hydratase
MAKFMVPAEVLDAQRALFARMTPRAPMDAARVGWKIGHAIEELDELGVQVPVVGWISAATVLRDGDAYHARGDRELRAETEIALELLHSVTSDDSDDALRAAIAGRRVALEIVDVARVGPGARSIIEGNIFHRAAVFGTELADLGQPVGRATLTINGTRYRQDDQPPCSLPAIRGVAAMLEACGAASLAAGDKILTGSVVHVPVSVGDTVCADIDAFGHVSVRVAP